ncbi:MAG: polyprenyl synthetase family protein [Muribaculaceae bacterium]|nr:polyprenyl synthetase family protein [Muribaculaceae bacterium]
MQTLDEIQCRLAPELREMNELIARYLATPNRLMNDIVSNYLRTKGKQIRPIMVLLSARMFGGVNEHALHAGAALEMLHNASLIHDDIVDETRLRRGVETINARWGNHLAVLVGDFFVSNALAAGIRTGRISIIAALSDLGKELSLGEVDQICNARSNEFVEEDYIEMIRKKTASLFMNCVRMGAEAVDAPAAEVEPMVEYAGLLGLCFQIKDDIFDYYPNPQIGKPTGNDLREHKVTLPLIHALNTAPDAGPWRELLREGRELTEDEILSLLAFARDNGGIDYAYARMREMQREADRLIAPYPDSEWKQAFRDIFEFIISRDR